MAQVLHVDGFNEPKEGQNYHDKSKEYTYFVKFREFEHDVMVVKKSPSLQIGQELFGTIEEKTSQKGNVYYRFKGARRDQQYATNEQQLNAPAPSQSAPQPVQRPVPAQKTAQTAPVKATEKVTSDTEKRMWAYEQAVKLVASGAFAYDDLIGLATDAYNNLDLIKQNAAGVVALADLPNDNPVKAVFQNVSATPPLGDEEMPADFLLPDAEQTTIG